MAQNVIIMIGDGMGWEMTRAGAVQAIIEQEIADYRAENPTATNQEIYEVLFADDTLQDPEYYNAGQGFGTHYQDLDGYVISTTGNAYIEERGLSALEGTPFNHNTGEPEVREGFVFNPSATISEGIANGTYDDTLLEGTGNVPIFDPELGGLSPWDPNYYENRGNPTEGFSTEYIKNVRPDSAGTATGLYTGVKTYVGAIAVDIFEETVETTAEAALDSGKSTGVVSSVPFNHATPAAAIAHINQRNKLHDHSFDQRAGNDNSDPTDDVDEFGHSIEGGDNIFRQIVEETKPTVVLGGGHYLTRGGTETEPDDRYITFEETENLRNGVYDYTFVERGPNAANVLAETAASLDPEAGDRLLGVYGARGQGGNLPWRSANDDYSHAGTVRDSGKVRTERPLEAGETDEQFIAREVNENPNLSQLSAAALDVLENDTEGFWLMIEGGDIDWAAHDEDMDAMLGTLKDFDDSVAVVQDWIAQNGGYEENLLIVTADHDHYLTLLDNFPQVLAQDLLLGEGGLSLTEDGAPLEVRGAAIEESQEVGNTPIADTDAEGTFDASLDGDILTVTGSFQSLTSALFDVSADGIDSEGNPVDSIHLHQGPAGSNGDVIRSLAATPDETGLAGTFSGTFTLSNEEVTSLLSDELYVNLHTENNPAGELRGQVELSRSYGDAEASGHFWGTDFTVDDNGTPEDVSDNILTVNDKYAWGRHTSRPVPVYFQGPSQDEAFIQGFVGQGYEAYGVEVEGVGTYIDQVHLGLAQLQALEDVPELVSGTTGDDELFAIPDSEFDGTNDILFTGSGADEVDVAIGGNGRNRINTGSGDDLIFVGDRDRVSGSSGNDEFDATDAERYRLSGGDGDDIFFLGTNGRALGGDGNDSFFVQEGGDNLLSGGHGADAFWIVNGDLPASSNTILDFEIGTDVIGISSQGSLTFDDLGLSGNEISINSTVVAVFQGIDTTTLDANSFAFA